MTVRRTRHRPRSEQPPAAEPDTTELELQELLVLWPRLHDALARDGAGPSAGNTGSGGGGGKNASPAPLDTDTADTMVVIATGVHAIAAEALPLLNITPPRIAIRRLNAMIAAAEQRRATARAVVARARGRELDDEERFAVRQAVEVVIEAASEIVSLRGRIARVQHRASTLGVIEVMPAWYARLRDAKQPLAKHIEQDVRRWVRAARSALRLRTAEVRIGWLCPHHRDAPAGLVRDRDEATLNPAVLAGGSAATGIAPLSWRRAESVHCPSCGIRWSGIEQLRVLMKMIEESDKAAQPPAEVDGP